MTNEPELMSKTDVNVGAVEAAAPPASHGEGTRTQWLRRLAVAAPFLLAVFFGLWSLREVSSNNAVDSDAARHAMNGAYIYDLVREGQILSPIEYGRFYYGRLPALSLPFHPPLFPAIEALFFAILGLNLSAARIAVACFTALSAFLFHTLVLRTTLSHVTAAAATLTFLSMPRNQDLFADVMLEFPSMAFAVGALLCLVDRDGRVSLARWTGFGLLAGAAVWTKQHTVFLILVPFLFVLCGRRWKVLLSWGMWISAVLLGAIVFSLTLLSVPFELTGVNQMAQPKYIGPVFWYNLSFYTDAVRHHLGTPAAAFILITLLVMLVLPGARRKWAARFDLHIAWVLAALLVLLGIGLISFRYTFYLYPPLIVIGYGGVMYISRKLVPDRHVWILPAAIALLYAGVNLRTPAPFMRGPDQAARIVHEASPKRVLYCGQTDGSFIFAIRSLQSLPGTIVIRGGKLDGSTFHPVVLEEFAHTYGIDHIVLERIPAASPWDILADQPAPSMELLAEVPLESSQARWNGDLRVYRFTNPSPNPRDHLEIPIPMIGGTLDVRF